MKELPIGIQSICDVPTGGCAHGYKRAFTYEVTRKRKYYFFARPRRLGKSLFGQMLRAMSLSVGVEVPTTLGYIDFLMATKNIFYVHRTKARKQHRACPEAYFEKVYYKTYRLHQGKYVGLSGVNISSAARNIEGQKDELLDENSQLIQPLQ